MSDDLLERALGAGGVLVALGLVVQLVSFLWIHPLAFIAFAAAGGLVGVGMAVVLWVSYRQRSWWDPVVRTGSERVTPDRGQLDG